MSDNKEVEILTNFIGNEFVSPTCGKYLPNVNPATNQIIAQVPRSDATDVQKAVDAASAAFPKWSALPHDVRASYLDRIANLMEERIDEWAVIESRDSGKPFSLAKRVDIPRAIANFRFFAGAVRHDFTESHAMADALNYTHRAAVGVAGLITPWNLPIYLLSWKVAPALAMGNVVIAKPSELTPMTAMALAKLCHEIGLPTGVFNLVHGLGGEVGQALVAHKDIHLISFTGGTATGEIVARTAAPMFKKLSLELGGKNSTVVFADAEFNKAVDGVIRSSFSNQGQICLCGSRVFIQDTIYDKFLAAMVEQVKSLIPGDPSTSNYGSLVSQQHREKIEFYVDLAKKEGGTILYGGSRPSLPEPFSQGAFYMPTIITNLSPASRCSREEIFGPVITVHKFSTEAEVTAEISAVRYGLAGSLWTTNLQVAHRVSRAWQTGMVWVNCWLHRDLRVPFGGWKDSGTGTEGGRYSLDFYSQVKNICIHHGD